MKFQLNDESHDIHLRRCMLIHMKNDAKYKWKHSIPTRQTDIINGKVIKRDIRYSITFRELR